MKVRVPKHQSTDQLHQDSLERFLQNPKNKSHNNDSDFLASPFSLSCKILIPLVWKETKGYVF